MAAGRPKRYIPKLDPSYDSVLEQLNMLLKQLQDVRAKALSDYKEVKYHTLDNADRIQLEQIRSNTFKSFENYFKLWLEVVKIHAMVAGKLSTKDNDRIAESLDRSEKEDLDAYLAELKEDLRKNRNGKK